MNTRKQVLVYLANSVQGGAVARNAVRQGFAVRALVRDGTKSDALRRLGVEVFTGDLGDPQSLGAAHSGIDYVVLQMPFGPMQQVRTLTNNAMEVINAHDVRGIVLKLPSANPMVAANEPGFVANEVIENIVRASGVPFSIVRPTMYLDNLLRPDAHRELTRNDTVALPVREAQRVAWTTIDDTADAAMRILQTERFGGDHLISNMFAMNGTELAAEISKALRRSITFRSASADDLEREVDAAIGAGVGKRVASKFHFFERNPLEADRMLATPFEPSPELGDFCPTPVRDWFEERAALFARA